ncbi:pilus motility taxis protein HmpF [Tumidithrix elongata RA019]|uniref:Pilus motility taxis protein HmpF n=1 Tax=Tumidithrix elongata BACA0141 TaxID=2716417 RepID=A0AAW9PR04_9CYAN|nr:pilus motility taxis protein HmpF [Tumidithrix elongata RA019]
MQYLAEVQKQTAAFGVGGKAVVRLLARNAGENNWQAINNEQTIPIQDANQAKEAKDGQLVIADISASNQLQSLQDASKRIVSILQTFSRAQEKYKAGEDEVEQWKQSLNFQSQELHRRETELEVKEQEFEQLDFKKQEVEEAQEQLRKEREEFDKWRQRLEAEQQRLDAQAASLNTEQAAQLRDLVTKLMTCLVNPHDIQDKITSSLNVMYQRQEILTGFWQELDTQKQDAEKQKNALAKASDDLKNRRNQWQQTQVALADAQAELKAQRGILKLQENNLAIARVQLEAQSELFAQTSQIVESLGGSSIGILDPDEARRLEEMPIQELEASINAWQAEFDKMSSYFGAQEDELAALEGEIADFQSQIAKADQFARIELESNKEFAEEQYKLLEEALAGQRRNIQERQSILTQQKAILERRQSGQKSEGSIQSLLPLLVQVETQKTRQEQEIQKMETQIEAVKSYTQQQQELLSRQTHEHQQLQQEIQQAFDQLQEQMLVTGELLGKVNTQEKILRPVQDVMDLVRPQLEAVANALNTSDPAADPIALATELQNAIASLMS